MITTHHLTARNEALHSQLGHTVVVFESFHIEIGNDAALTVSLNHSLVSGAVGISPRTRWAWKLSTLRRPMA